MTTEKTLAFSEKLLSLLAAASTSLAKTE